MLTGYKYEEVQQFFELEPTDNVLLSYHGVLSQDLINTFTNELEEVLFRRDAKKAKVKKVFSILVEGLQNILLHSEPGLEGEKEVFFIVQRHGEHYQITFANFVQADKRNFLKEKLDNILSLRKEELKDLYMEILTNGIISRKGGAGLGFVTMALKSDNRLAYSLEELRPGACFFSLKVEIV